MDVFLQPKITARATGNQVEHVFIDCNGREGFEFK